MPAPAIHLFHTAMLLSAPRVQQLFEPSQASGQKLYGLYASSGHCHALHCRWALAAFTGPLDWVAAHPKAHCLSDVLRCF